jgi:uncharacterized protein YbbK (DUF523 family)
MNYLISSCLIGLCCRFDGTSRPHSKCMDIIRRGEGFPVCPEQLAGLPTPRSPSVIIDGDGFDVLNGKARVFGMDGKDRTECFLKGADETLKLARLAGVEKVIFKERSPSCGVRKIYQGECLVEGCGVTSALLLKEGLQVFSSESIDSSLPNFVIK